MTRLSVIRSMLCALTAVALCWGPARAQDGAAMAGDAPEGDGLIVRIQSGNLVFIDKGARDGIESGELFDVISSEILVHPLSDSILAVTPMTVGALQILQVYQRTALARLVYMDLGQDPMLKPIVRIRDPERRAQVDKQLMHALRTAAGLGVSRRTAVVPGLYQIQAGQTRKGWALLGAEALTLGSAFAYRSNSNDWRDQYQNLPAGLQQRDYDFYFTKADDRRTTSNRLFWLAGAIYLYNWADVLWLGGGASLADLAAPDPRLQVGVGWTATPRGGTPLLRLTRRW